MDRQRLIKKRTALKAKREIEYRLRRIDDLIKHFNRHEIEYRIHIDCEQANEAIVSYLAEFPDRNWDKIPNSEKVFYGSVKANEALVSYPAIGSSRLDWDKIPNSEKVFYSSDAERDEIISTVITRYLDRSDTTFVIWEDGYTPILEMTANLVAENSGVMADKDWNMWVLNLEKGFCLEHYYRGHVAWSILSPPAQVMFD